MQNKKFFHPSVKTWALAISSSAVLIACGGGSDSDTTSPTPEPEETKTAAHCFDDTLNFTPGNSFDIELNLYNNVEGTIKISRNVQIEGNATHYPTGRVDSAINGLIARTENNTVTAPADITTSYTRINTQFIRPISPDNEIINVGEFQRYFAPNVIRTSNSYSIYNPEYIDQRKELKQNESQTVSFSNHYCCYINLLHHRYFQQKLHNLILRG